MVLVCAALTAAGSSASATARPALSFVDREPVIVRGSSFRPGEQVTLTVRVFGEGQARRVMRASATGGFTARFGAFEVGDCDAYVVRAVGNSGSSASMRQQLPPCGPLP